MSEHYTHSYITFSILNYCNSLKFNVFWWVLWVYRWFKYKYKNWEQKAHKTEHSRVKENWRKNTEPSPIDRGTSADRSAGISKNRSKKAERPPIDRGIPADRSALFQKIARNIADRSRHSSRSIGQLLRNITLSAPIDSGTEPIDWQNLLMQNVIVFQTFKTPNFRQN